MSQFKSVLVVVQDAKSAKSLISKAAAICTNKPEEQPSSIHVVRVVYEGSADSFSKKINPSADLKSLILKTEEDELHQAVNDFGPPGMTIESVVIWNRRLWAGVIQAANSVSADLIIKVSEDDGRGIIRTPDDWNLLRESNVPVFLTRPDRWNQPPTILVAIDALDEFHDKLSRRILEQAAALSQRLSGDLHICSCYPLFEPWSMRLGLLQNYSKLRKELERDIALAVARLVHSTSYPSYKLHSIEGSPELGIEQLARKIDADIVIIGNLARDGLEAVFIGNTAEKILHRTQNDILTIM